MRFPVPGPLTLQLPKSPTAYSLTPQASKTAEFAQKKKSSKESQKHGCHQGNSPLSGPDSLQFLPVILQYFQQRLLCSNLLQTFVFLRRASLCNSPTCPRTCFVNQAGIELTCLDLPSVYSRFYQGFMTITSYTPNIKFLNAIALLKGEITLSSI